MSSFAKGILLVLIYNVLSAANGVYLGALLQGVNPILALLCSFSIVAVFFGATEVISPSPNNPPVRKGGWDLVMVNVMTAVAWFGFYFAEQNMEPAVVSAVANSLGPIVTLVVAVWMGVGNKPKGRELLASLGVLGSMGLLIGATWQGKGALTSLPRDRVIVGIVTAVLCGVAMAINTLFSKRLNKQGWSARKILAHRFYAVIALGALFLPSGSTSWLAAPSHVGAIVLIAVVGVIIPLYAFQLGVEKLEPVVVALVLSTVPLFALIVQSLDSRLEFSPFSLVGILLVMVFSCLGVLIRSNRFALVRERA